MNRLYSRTAVLIICTFLSHDAEAMIQNLFNRIGGGGVGGMSKSTPAPLCKRVDLGTLSVSPMGLGTLNLPLDKEVDDETSSVLKTANKFDINFVDTAEAVSTGMHCVYILLVLCVYRYGFCRIAFNDLDDDKR